MRLVRRCLWWMRVAVGALWAGALLYLGLMLVEHQLPLAIALLAAGEFVLMTLVLDALCPRAYAAVTGTFKFAAAGTLMASLGWVVLV